MIYNHFTIRPGSFYVIFFTYAFPPFHSSVLEASHLSRFNSLVDFQLLEIMQYKEQPYEQGQIMTGFSRFKDQRKRLNARKAAVCACLTRLAVLIQSGGGTKGWQVKESSKHCQARCSALKLGCTRDPRWLEREVRMK